MLEWRTIFVPLSAGMNQKADPRALEAPALAVCRDAMFDEAGGAQTRFPFVGIGSSILGGGSLSNIRRLATNGDELLAFTQEALYSWSVRDAKWVLKGTHLAAKVTEREVFVGMSEQYTCERAEMSGVVVFAWVQPGASGADTLHVAAIDKTTGAILLSPVTYSSGTGDVRPRMVALTTKILLVWVSDLTGTPDLVGTLIDPTDLAGSVTGSATLTVQSTAQGFGGSAYDMTSSGSTAYLITRRTPNTSYTMITVTNAGVIVRTTIARQADSGVALALAPNGTHVQIFRANGAAVQGDYLTIAGPFADVTINQAIFAVTATTIAAAYRSVQDSGQYRCYAFVTTLVNYVDTGGTIGTAATHVTLTALTSRAFDHNGRVFVWRSFDEVSGTSIGGFRGALQNTYFLYRDDGFLCAKAAVARSGGDPVVAGWLPGVQSLGGSVYAFAGVERRVIPLGQLHKGFSARVPREVLVEFDSDEARRTARLGPTLYITGGEILQYDGKSLYEVGFHVYPWYLSPSELSTSGAVENGTYTVKATWRWDNAKGERDRSTSAIYENVTISAGPNSIAITAWYPLPVTHKIADPLAVEVWRTLKNPGIDSPFFLVTSQDPATLTGANRYVKNEYQSSSLATFQDDLADSVVKTLEAHDEIGDVLERLAPPPATIIAATQDRIFLAGISDQPHQVWYSRLRGVDEVASFHDSLVVEVPPTGGAITALGFLNETLIVFCEHAVWALPGDGFDNAGQGQNYGPARVLSSDLGATTHDSVALTPKGLVFQSRKGIYLLDPGWEFQFIGASVDSFTDEVSAVQVMESRHQVRFLSNTGWMLVWDYLVGQWSEWTIGDGLHSVVWGGTHHYCTASAVLAEQGSYGSSVTYAMDLETAWISVGPGGKLGRGKVLWIQVLGEFVSAHDLRLRVGRDYLSDSSGATLFHSKFWPATPTTVGGRLQVQHAPSIRLMEAVKLRITPYASGSTVNPPTGGALKVTGFALHIGLEKGVWRSLAAAQRQ